MTEPSVTSDDGAPPPRPRWVKALIFVLLGLVALLILLQVTGAAGEHGPGRHMGLSASATVVLAR